MNQTPNYQLNQWEPEDRVLRADFNADNAKIDGALAQKADSSAVTALGQRVDSKADASALDTLKQTVAQNTVALGKKGNCKIWTTTYVGTGRAGQSNPTRLSFPSTPLMVLIQGTDGVFGLFIPGQTQAFAHQTSGSILNISWSGNTVSFYHHSDSISQLNNPYATYRVVALMEA